MPLYPYPDIPPLPGVPPLPRSLDVPPAVGLIIGEVASILLSALQSPAQWGIIDENGNVLGGSQESLSIIQSIQAQVTGQQGPILSFNALEYLKETRISDFPVEEGGFATYNKVEFPGNPTVTLALAGSPSDRSAFLNAIDAACLSTTLYFVVTPETVYGPVSLERYSYQRRSDRGATLLMVEISLKEIRQVTAQYSTVTTPINDPQSPNAVVGINTGSVQAGPPDQSTLKSASNAWQAWAASL
jgi:hypothetical protein